jgi:hypothetical protein
MGAFQLTVCRFASHGKRAAAVMSSVHSAEPGVTAPNACSMFHARGPKYRRSEWAGEAGAGLDTGDGWQS